ncbi:High-affinity gluconate transporter GntT [Salmonella enterica subsp. enterica]|uniref:High-affinity gluconate transporter GntT n=1 Tax=Salmonella enterica I TaxID=59201 RepID=A0A447N2P3_SALET|nr:High-affinity gluconate transporter GntT [Salmonella enterica subsp. enterica]
MILDGDACDCRDDSGQKATLSCPLPEFLGDPVMATLIAVLIAMFTFGLNRGRSMDQINDTLVSSIKIIAMMLLIIGGGGAFKQVLVDSGVDKYIASNDA